MTRIAYLPLTTYPEAVEDRSIEAAVRFAATIDCSLEVRALAVSVPRVSSGLGDLLIDMPGLARAMEERSRSECGRVISLVRQAAGTGLQAQCATREVPLSDALTLLTAESRFFDLTIIPWSADTGATNSLTEAVVFGSGRPAILIPPADQPRPINHIAIAWDGSRVAARALGDALPLLEEGARISVLTVRGEKPLSSTSAAADLAFWLGKRGYEASAAEIPLAGRKISDALQEAALAEGCQLLAMGGFGHSRLRDFVLGGATQGVMANLRLPVLLSH